MFEEAKTVFNNALLHSDIDHESLKTYGLPMQNFTCQNKTFRV